MLLCAASVLSLWEQGREAASAHFRLAAEDRIRAIRSEVQQHLGLLDVLSRVLAMDNASPAIVQRLLDDSRGSRNEGQVAFWCPWDGTGEPAAIWPHTRVFSSGNRRSYRRVPGWFGDALRRAARSTKPITVPADEPGGGELLLLASAVRNSSARLKGVVLVSAYVSDVVEDGLSRVVPVGVDLSIEDASLGGRAIYPYSRAKDARAARSQQFTYEAPLGFADRQWVLRCSAPSDFARVR
jgi:hypothetical protein